MCVSAKIETNLRKLEREYGATIDRKRWVELFLRRLTTGDKIPKGIELQFEDPQDEFEREIKQAIDAYRATKSAELEQTLFAQKKRLADAERILASKPTKKAENDKRIATNKIEDSLRRIEDLRRTEPKERDDRIYPYYFCPIIIADGKERSIIPARYLCRPAGKPAFYDTKFPGCFNARRDSLADYWKGLFGSTHALFVISSFYENVPLQKVEHRELREGEKEQNVVLHFIPRNPHNMAVACVWSHWTGKEGEAELDSFAAITDEPNPEVAAAGHDRTIVTVEPKNFDAWLSPQNTSRESLYALFDNRERPYFEHRKAA